MSSERYYHVNVRARSGMRRVWVFNLTRERLEVEVLKPWLARAPFELGDEDWEPRLAELVIFEGRHLEGPDLGLGEGPNSARRTGENVTSRVLGEAEEAASSPPPAVAAAPPRAASSHTERVATRLLEDLAALDGVSIDNEEALDLLAERLRVLGVD
jgi:hypothetical protein